MAPVESGNLERFAKLSLAVLESNVSLAKTFLVDTSAKEFRAVNAAGSGGTIDIVTSHIKREPGKVHTKADRAARNEFIYSNLQSVQTSITLEDYYYYGVSVNYNEATFLELAWQQDLIPTSGQNVAEKINSVVTAKVNAVIDADATAPVALTGTDEEKANQIIKKLISLRKELNDRGVPAADRTAAVASDVAAVLLVSPQFRDVGASGTADALTEASLGRKYGFNLVEEAGLTDGSVIAYGKQAFGLVLRTKAPSKNAIESTVVDNNGFVLNVTIDRDGRHDEDLLKVGTFAGFDQLDPLKSVVAKFTGV